MTPADFANATRDYDLHRRAFAACVVAEPHLDADEDSPCSRHLLRAAEQLAIPHAHVSAVASAGATDGPAAVGAPANGAAEREATEDIVEWVCPPSILALADTEAVA